MVFLLKTILLKLILYIFTQFTWGSDSPPPLQLLCKIIDKTIQKYPQKLKDITLPIYYMNKRYKE